MRVAANAFNGLGHDEIAAIHRNVLRILAEVGMLVESPDLLGALADFGGTVDRATQTVRFSPAFVERFLAESERFDWDQATPQVTARAGVYLGYYHVPGTDRLEPWTLPYLLDYFHVAKRLEHIGGAGLLGCPLGVPAYLEPLYERLYAWKYGAEEHGTIQVTECCPYILEMTAIYADAIGQPLADVFRGTVYLASPLRLARNEAEQVAYFWKQGLRVRIGNMLSAGGTAPVTLAGAVTLNLAEQLLINLIERALFGERRLHLSCSISVLDMSTLIYPYGRPEMAITNLMTAQLARFYGASFHGHCGLADAKLPSVEAGAQKALTAIPTLLLGGSAHLDAGLLSIDQVFSPIQMILDNEFIGALRCFAREYRVDDEVIGFDVIRELGPGKIFLETEHTARFFRSEHWQPRVWSRQMVEPWMRDGRRLDVDFALERYREIVARSPEPPRLSERVERDLLAVIESARQRFG
ncbi:MAG: trimethylamine methyltransferase family protein [Anaerolineae bacterium]|nr:trimethylamine methyltransferase family protein [Anaerolineae bacterium]